MRHLRLSACAPEEPLCGVSCRDLGSSPVRAAQRGWEQGGAKPADRPSVAATRFAAARVTYTGSLGFLLPPATPCCKPMKTQLFWPPFEVVMGVGRGSGAVGGDAPQWIGMASVASINIGRRRPLARWM